MKMIALARTLDAALYFLIPRLDSKLYCKECKEAIMACALYDVSIEALKNSSVKTPPVRSKYL